uniref:Aminomethyltransferase folate-binding domain-containing protein n=1 Tax=Kalanchoe fedtschenkoi TaxID=63787 RepID=A0A7N0UED2_KALFE
MTHTINPSSLNYVISAGLSSKPTTGRMVLPKSRSLLTMKPQPQLVLSAADIHHTNTSTSVAASSFHISPPPIDQDIPDTVADEDVVPILDGNDEEALNAFYNGVAVANLSDFGRIRVSGEDRIQFLQNQTTADFGCLSEGQGIDTVFVTPTARTIDIAHAWVMKNAITLMVSPGTCESITSMLTKYIFFADKVEIHEFTKETCFFVLVGPKSCQVMNSLNLSDLVGKPYGTHLHYNVNGLPITVGVGSIISEDGFSMLVSATAAKSVWNTLLAQGAIPMGSDAWERLRIYEGRPAPGKELTQEFNVLEAGFWSSISLKKGCYKGQETIARLVTYDGVKQKLWGLRLSAPAEPGSPITVDGKKAGMLTSYAPGMKEFKHVGLGYIKTKAASEGHTVTVGNNVSGEVVDVPFLMRQRRKSVHP